MINLSHTENQIKNATNFKDLITSPFQGEVNAMCWNRNLIGNFSEIINKVVLKENITILLPEELHELALSEEGKLARKILLNDLKLLKEHGALPTLNIIKNYERDDAFPFFPTDVYSFHVDRSPIPTDTFLCTYHGEPSDILPNAQGTQKILIPEIRTELKKLYGEESEEGFEDFLSEFFFDLHYQAKPNAQIINLGIGHLWKLAIDHPESKVLPCLHRAPKEKKGEPRLMMIC
jgi:hypothetical protein